MRGVADRRDGVTHPVTVDGAAVRAVGRDEMHAAILAAALCDLPYLRRYAAMQATASASTVGGPWCSGSRCKVDAALATVIGEFQAHVPHGTATGRRKAAGKAGRARTTRKPGDRPRQLTK
ncbi:hypothetical protein GCM10014715_19050 [Streptomyces spiralis]|uniref:Uncharacterized protein n=1 Tax=Streptomyces spiralis TaxID=66376 RepID=A0A918ZQU4_9ACTN|nr:hypothetical protein GCM10014715_19050 [Streptomyces spiralis]